MSTIFGLPWTPVPAHSEVFTARFWPLPWLSMRCDDARHTGSAHGMLGIAWLWRCGPQLEPQLGGQYGLLPEAQKRQSPKSDQLQISPARFGGMLRALAHRHHMSWDTK